MEGRSRGVPQRIRHRDQTPPSPRRALQRRRHPEGRLRGSKKTTRGRDQRAQRQEKGDHRYSQPTNQHPQHTTPTATDSPSRKQNVARFRRVRRYELQSSQRRHRQRPRPSNGREERRGVNLQLPPETRRHPSSTCCTTTPTNISSPSTDHNDNLPFERPRSSASREGDLGGFKGCSESSKRESILFH